MTFERNHACRLLFAPHESLPEPAQTHSRAALCATVTLLLMGALCCSVAVAQTARFSGAVKTLGGGFHYPESAAVDGSGNVFVADTGNNLVKEIPAGCTASICVTTLGGGFATPEGVAVDGSGNVFVADTGHNAVKEILAVNGSIPASPTIDTLGGGFLNPIGVAVDLNDNVFVGDSGNNAVKEIPAGCISSACVTTLGGGFAAPEGVAVAAGGNVFVADVADGAVKEIPAGCISSACVTTLGGGFVDPAGVAVDRSGNVFVGEYYASGPVEEIPSGCASSTCVTTLGGGFLNPIGVAVDLNDNVFVGDSDNNAVKEIERSAGNFGAVAVGVTSPQTFQVHFIFATAGTLGSTAVLAQGAPNLDFTDAGGGTCTAGDSYDAGDSCYVNVAFKPRFAGTRYGAAVLKDSSGNVFAAGYVYGAGSGPQVNFLPGTQSTLGGGFNETSGVAVDGSGDVYLADLNHNAVKEIPPGCTSSACVTTLGGGFNEPFGVAVDGSGKVFVTDTNNRAVKEIPPGCASSACVTTLGGGFNGPLGVAADGSGNVFVADGAVKEIPAGCKSSTCVRTLGGGFNYPHGVAVDGSGNVFVGDSNNSAVKEIPAGCASSACVTVLGGAFNYPEGVAVDGSGNVFVADTNAVKEIPSGCTSSACVTTLGGDFTESPVGAAVDGSGNVFVCTFISDAVYELDFADPPSLTFAETTIGSTSTDSPRTVTIMNIGNLSLNFLAIGFPEDFPEDIAAADDCSTGGSLAAGASCTVTVNFEPKTPGPLNSMVVLVDNSLNQAFAVQEIPVSARGLAAQTITFTPPSPVNYGVSPITLTAIGGASGNPVTFSIISGPGSLSGANNSILTVTGGGIIVVAANQAGNTDYAAAPQVTRSIVVDQPAALTSPAPGSTLTGSSATFTWSAGGGVTLYQFRLGTTGPGSNNVYNAAKANTTSLTTGLVSNLPAGGGTLFARIYSMINGAWQYNDYTYKESGTPVVATLTSPAPGTTLTGASATFTWTAGAGVTMYQFRLGTTGPGSTNVYNAAKASTTALTTGLISNIPAGGGTLYARLYSLIDGAWQYNDYTYIESGTPHPAILLSPTIGSTLTGTSATFTWSAGEGVSYYMFLLGTTGQGSNNLYNSADATTTALTSGLISNIPAGGGTLYAQICSYINGVRHCNDYTYIESGTPARAVLTSPTPGSTLTGTNATFTWSAGEGVSYYMFVLGTTGPGSNNVYNEADATTTALTTGVVSNIPVGGGTLYANLCSYINGVLYCNDYTYKEAQ